jgi:acyl carrier protein
MTKADIQQKLIEMAAEQAGVAVADVTPATHFVNDLNFDSLDQVEFAMEVEDEFSLSVPDEDVEKLQTVEAVRDYVAAHLDETPETAA